MRLLKQAMEPKEQLKLIHGFVNDWDVAAKPQLILSDRGSIFVSKHAIEVVCDRFGILADRAPPRDPEAKGQIESVFTWLIHANNSISCKNGTYVCPGVFESLLARKWRCM